EARTDTFGGLVPRTRYGFALVTVDSAGNRSQLSNIAVGVTATGGPLAQRPGPGIAPATRPSRASVDLFWRGAGTVAPRIECYDVLGRRVRVLPLSAIAEGIQNWNGRDDD